LGKKPKEKILKGFLRKKNRSISGKKSRKRSRGTGVSIRGEQFKRTSMGDDQEFEPRPNPPDHLKPYNGKRKPQVKKKKKKSGLRTSKKTIRPVKETEGGGGRRGGKERDITDEP